MMKKQQIWIAFQETGRFCWLLLKSLLQLIAKGLKYVYLHRVQIMQHKVTLPVLIVLSIIWTGFSSFRYSSPNKSSDFVQTDYTVENTVDFAPSTYVHLTSNDDSDKDDTPVDEPFRNTRLISYIMEWVGTPHRDNTQSKSGTDCSGFVQAVYQDAHGIKLSRNSRAMYDNDVHKISKSKLQEGDLVFFNTFGNDISHVGIYLKDGKFAHTSTSKGVTVSSLNERYYQKNYRAAGRVKMSKLSK